MHVYEITEMESSGSTSPQPARFSSLDKRPCEMVQMFLAILQKHVDSELMIFVILEECCCECYDRGLIHSAAISASCDMGYILWLLRLVKRWNLDQVYTPISQAR
eukprot:TRINITY_DN169749_c0_g1_i1.p1 TRINITY_DN169749_c0_g1~~TRINITY_DN169749_c0_g1_i1.p1  ORF type:complete len:105 (-),score=3.79 TRINITY_DN169749_c0_g1_i1:98-412(-)